MPILNSSAPLSRERDLESLKNAWTHHGRSLQPAEYLKIVGRLRNEFRGKNFRDADLFDVDFRKGIDLSLQRLPDKPQYVYLPDAAAALNYVRGVVADMPDPPSTDAAQMLAILEKEITGGQVQLLLRTESHNTMATPGPS